jgi:uncharacterized protein (TIGR03086 family)
MNTVTAFEDASARMEKLVAGVSPDAFSAPTPCPDWDVRALLNHLVGTLREFEARFSGQEPGDRADLLADKGDLLGDDHVEAYREAAQAVFALIRPEGALDRKYPTPVGDLPGSLLAETAVLDLAVHGWDLAKATGQDTHIDEPLADHALVFAEGFITDQMRASVYGPVVPIVDNAPAGDRLVAFLGRQP